MSVRPITTTIEEQQILFSGPMVRAILDGRKTQTRRIVKLYRVGEYDCIKSGNTYAPLTDSGPKAWGWREGDTSVLVPMPTNTLYDYSPYGKPGDRLWVRENWATGEHLDSYSPSLITEKANDSGYISGKLADLWYQTDDTYFQFASSPYMFGEKGRWRPSIHMPRWASRIDLEITNVRVERLWDITEENAKHEGIDIGDYRSTIIGIAGREHRLEFAELWKSINGSGSWDANPWVWVVEFKRIKW